MLKTSRQTVVGGPAVAAPPGRLENRREPQMVLRMSGDLYQAWVVIDSVVDGTSSGGVRIAADLDEGEVKSLAREMTLKYRFFGLPRGGAKTGVRVVRGLGRADLHEALEDFGSRLGPIIRAGLYYPGMDLNCGPDELRALYRGAGIPVGNLTDTSLFTALSVRAALEALCATVDFPSRTTLAVEGFGRVAAYLAERLDPSRFHVGYLSTVRGAVRVPGAVAPAELAALKSKYGDDLVTRIPGGEPVVPADVLTAEVEIFLPSARVASVSEEAAGKMGCHAVLPIANAPYAAGAAGRLHRRGVIVLPGYVVNGGGVFASSLKDRGVPLEEIERLCDGPYREVVVALLAAARRGEVSPIDVAADVAARSGPDRSRRLGTPGLRRSLTLRLERTLTPRRVRASRALAARARHFSSLVRTLDSLWR